MKKTIITLLQELRQYILVWIFIFFILFIICFCFRQNIYNVIIQPLYIYNKDYINFFVYTSIFETFLTDISLSLYCSFFLNIPIAIILIYKFIAKSLYKNEKLIFLKILLLSIILFCISIVITYKFLLPRMIVFFTSLSTIAKPMLKISEYVYTFFSLTISISVIFQFPILLILLTKFGLIKNDFLEKHRKLAIVFIFIIAAIVTPPDVFSQLFVAIFLIIIYEITNFIINKGKKKFFK